MKKVFNVLASLVLGVCVLLLLAVFLVPALWGFNFHIILSGSMEPAIKTGAMTVTREIKPEEVQVGDIIGFKMENVDIPICHRVIEIVENEEGIGFLTKGDANAEPDDWIVRPESLMGKTVFHLPWLGYVAKFVRTPYGFGLLIGLPALLIVVLEIKNLFWPKPARRRRLRLLEKPSQFPAHLSVLIGLVLIGVLGGMMLGNHQERTLGSFARESEEDGQPVYVAERIIQNRGVLPLVICFYSEDKVGFSEKYFRLSPGEQKTVEITGDSAEAVIRTGGFLPLLPRENLYQLFAWNWRLAPFMAAAVWIFPLMLITLIVLRRLHPELKFTQRVKLMKRRLSYE